MHENHQYQNSNTELQPTSALMRSLAELGVECPVLGDIQPISWLTPKVRFGRVGDITR